MFKKIACLVVFVLFTIGCKNTHDKIKDLVTNYNRSSHLIQSELLINTTAEALPNNKIKLVFETSLTADSETKAMYAQVFPSLLVNLIESDPSSLELVNEGVVFEVVFLSNAKTELVAMTIDKKKLEEIKKTATKKSDTQPKLSANNLSPQLNEMLEMLNRNLPFEDKSTGTKIMKIDINTQNELIYLIEVPEKMGLLLEGDEAQLMLKEQIQRGPDIKKIFGAVNTYGITKIIYSYKDTKGKAINEIVFTASELQ